MTSASPLESASWTGAPSRRRTLTMQAAPPEKTDKPRIWRSKISWRIAFSVFLTILVVQGAILLINFKQREQELLTKISDIGHSVLAPSIPAGADFLTSPIDAEHAERILSTTIIDGLAIYSGDYRLLATYGRPVTITPGHGNAPAGGLYDGVTYEKIYSANDLQKSYFIAATLDASSVSDALLNYVRETLSIILLVSAFVTVVLMITLSKWLLEPILLLRENFLAATLNPEEPSIKEWSYDNDDEVGGTITMAQTLIRENANNIKQIKSAAEDKIHKLAYFDQLTGLPNRIQFLQKLTDIATGTDRELETGSASRHAIIAMDLDHFKDINDSMGHNVGDAILRGVGKRLRAALPATAVVARSGEDEFAITVPLEEEDTPRSIGKKIADVVRSEPFRVFNEAFQIRASIGVSIFPDDGTDPDHVLKNADIALNRAKEEGRDTIKEYSEDFDRAVQMRFQLLRDLRDAMDAKDLMIYFQPQFDLSNGKIIGAEALLRWFKKDASKNGGHFISPAEFVPIAEQSGLIVPIGEWVIDEACRIAAEWERAGHNIRVAVNVSGAQFYQSDLVAHISKSLAQSGLSPHLLELEVTESVFMEDIQHTVDTLQQLHELGVELAIDDFGTGYSSLAYLRQFPIDRLKIDQSFIRNALNNSDDAAITRTIVRLGHSLNLKVIAEGVETKEHESFLAEEKCDEVQGFRYSKPIPVDEFNKFVMGYVGDFSVFDR